MARLAGFLVLLCLVPSPSIAQQGGAAAQATPPPPPESQAMIPQACYAPGTDPDLIVRNAQRRLWTSIATSLEHSPRSGTRDQYAGQRWTHTATDGGGLTQGDATTLIWSIVPDGTPLDGFVGEPSASSNLRAFLDGIYGSEATWLPIFQSVFDDWSALTGIQYTYQAADDGAGILTSSKPGGLIGVRGDVRIAGHAIDGNYNTLAYNFFPNVGEMIIDTGDSFFANNAGGSNLGLRNVLAHELGHGIGLPHVCPINDTKLMEPSVSFSFDGPQHDDVQAMNRAYGDPFEANPPDSSNDTPGMSKPLGPVTNFSKAGLSIDDSADVDYLSFTVPIGKQATLTVTPVGSTYLSGAQDPGDGSCSAGSNMNTLSVHDLEIEILDTDGSTVLDTSNTNGSGAGESLADVLLASGAGTYYAVIRGDSANDVQMYDLTLSIEDSLSIYMTKSGTGTGTVTTSPAGIDCGSACAATFTLDQVVTLQHAADAGSVFVAWAGDADCTDGSVTMSQPVSCGAEFERITHTLDVQLAGTGSGTVTSSPTGIDCGGDCTEEFDLGTTVTLTPTPAAGSEFVGWSGDGDCTDGSLDMTADQTCTATFDMIPQHSLVVSKVGTGSGTVSSSPAGIDCGADCSETYDEDTVVALTATPAAGSTFVGWTGDADCSDGSVTMAANRTCTATFDVATQYLLTVSKAGTGAGTVTSSPAGIDCGADCSENFDVDTPVALTAVATGGARFDGWTGDADCTDGSVTMAAARNCTATFTERHMLTASVVGSGTGVITSSPAGIDCGADCNEVYDQGTVVNLTAVPDAGFIFVSWEGQPDCHDGSVSMAIALSCSAWIDEPTLFVDTVGEGTVTSQPAGIDCGADCVEDYPEGTQVTLTATPAAGWRLGGWTGSGCSNGSPVMSSQLVTCTATFIRQRQLTVTRSGSGSGTVTSSPVGIDCGADCSEDYDDSTVVFLTATPAPGSAFSGWTGAADCSNGQVTMSQAMTCDAAFNGSTEPLTITLAGSGSGVVTSNPPGYINCGADCSEDVPEDDYVGLIVTADPDSVFVGWSGHSDCSDGVVRMLSARACTATFDIAQRTLTVSISGDGSVSSVPAGIACGGDCSEAYDHGTAVSLTPVDGPAGVFSSWSGDADCTDGTVTLDADLSCQANFASPTYELQVSVAGSGSGSVSSSLAGINCPGDCAETFDSGTTVNLTATTAAGSAFAGWSGSPDCSDGSVTMDAARSCTATFDQVTWQLTVSRVGSGAGEVFSFPSGIDCGATCQKAFAEGTVVSLGVVPAQDSVFNGWEGTDCSGALTMNAPVSCTARFDLEPPPMSQLTVTLVGAGTGAVFSSPGGIACAGDCSELYPPETVVALQATAAIGSTFVGWSGDEDCSDGSLTMSAARSCTATFSLEPSGESLLFFDGFEEGTAAKWGSRVP